APLLVVGEVRAQVDLGELVLQTLPASAAILAHEPMPLEQHENDARLASRHARLLREIVEQRRLAERYLLQHDRDVRRLFDVRILPAEEIRLHPAVLDAIEERAHGRQSVATRTSR